MKKEYEAPILDVEVFQLNQSIALNCTEEATFSPETTDANGNVCDEWIVPENYSRRAYSVNNAMTNSECDCYNNHNSTTFSS